MSYRPITDTWILARSKVKYYGAYPSGFLHRARQLLGVELNDPVLHVCAGKIRDYPFRGLGPNDMTLDLDPACEPDYLQDANLPFPVCLQDDKDGWSAVLIDRPYTLEDAQHYSSLVHDKLPPANLLIKNAIAVVPVGGKIGMLDYIWPQPPKNAIEVAIVSVYTGRNNRARCFSVFERMS
jgi:hypothetical protein